MKKILLIEDDDGLVELITEKLEESGFSVASASSYAHASEYLKNQTPDLMLLDYSLPDLNGKELIKSINKLQLPLPPFIITTGQGDERIAVDMMKLGAQDYLIKDKLFLEKLPDAVKRVLKEIESDAKLKQAEEALKQSEGKLKTALESMTEAIFISDLEGNFIDFNEAFAAFHKFKNKKECTKTLKEYPVFLDVFYPDGEFVPLDMWVVSRALRGEIGLNKEYILKRKDTDETWVGSYNFSPIRNNEGDIVGSVVTARDITDLKKSQQEILSAKNKAEESEKKYRDLVNLAQEGIWVIDENNFTTFANPSMAKILGYTSEEMIGKSLFDFMDEKAVSLAQENLERRKAGLNELHDFEFISKNSEHIFCTMTTAPIIDKTGRYQGAIAGVIDITERKQEEKILSVELKLYEYAINHSNEDLLQEFLAKAEELTGSEISFYHYLEDDQETISLQTWSPNTLIKNCIVLDNDIRHYPISKAGVWTDCIKERKPVIHNDYSSLTHKKGLPEGHAPIIRELVVPVIRRDKIMAVFGVGNKKTDYKEADVKIIQRLADLTWETSVRKQAEENLTKTFDLSPSIICKANLDTGYFIEASQAVTRILGYSIEEFLSKPFIKLIHPDDQQKSTDEKDEQLRGKEISFFENRYLCKDGSYKWMAWHGTRADENGIVTAIGSDITERRHSEEQLEAEKERLAVTLSSIGDGVITTDVDGNVLLMNSIAEKLTGWIQHEAKGKPLKTVFNIISETTGKLCESPVEKVLSSGEIIELANNTVLVSRDGIKRNISDSGAPIKDKNNITIGVVLVFRDITEKLKIENAINSATKLESLGLLAGGIAHDFNNLLGGIFGYIEMAEKISKEDEVSTILKKSIDTIDRARNLTGQLLTFSKGGTPVCKVESLFPFIKETVNFALSGSNVIGQFDIQPDLRACNIDRNQIAQVIDNLIINANQAMPLGGQIDLSARNVSLKNKEHPLLEAGEYVKITIKDYGIGIPKQMLSRIFDPFFTTKPKGHGLGLATCYSIIKKHGGCIDVESEQGTGTVFHIYLPSATEAVSSPAIISVPSYKGRGTFVVMDDEEVIREAIGAILEDAGFEVECKENGQDMLDFLTCEFEANREIAGMIFDLTIPGAMGGKEAIKEVRKLNSEIPVFVSSGYGDDPVMANPTEYGFTASIAKPFRTSEFVNMLSKYMKSSEL